MNTLNLMYFEVFCSHIGCQVQGVTEPITGSISSASMTKQILQPDASSKNSGLGVWAQFVSSIPDSRPQSGGPVSA